MKRSFILILLISIFSSPLFAQPDGCECPENSTYDGAHCNMYLFVPDDYSGWTFNNKFYVTPNCNISTDNNCCPEGWTFDGANCNSGVTIPDEYLDQWFIFDKNNHLYVHPYCPEDLIDSDCCPDGWEYDGENCVSEFSIVDGNNVFRYYVKDGQIVSENPIDGSTETIEIDGRIYNVAPFTIPEPWHGFFVIEDEPFPGVFRYRLVAKPVCCDICPEETIFDGNACVTSLAIPEGYDPFDYNGKIYVWPNCDISTDNNCCPEGYTFDGNACASSYTLPEAYDEWFLFNEKLHLHPLCTNYGEEIGLCSEFEGFSRRENDFYKSWDMTQDGSVELCFSPNCVPDQLIITIDGVEEVNTGSLTSACADDPICLGGGDDWVDIDASDCSSDLQFLCTEPGNIPEECFILSWSAGSTVEIQVNANTCQMYNTIWRLSCRDDVGEFLIGESEEEGSVLTRGSTEVMSFPFIYKENGVTYLSNKSEVDFDFMIRDINGSIITSGTLLKNSDYSTLRTVIKKGLYFVTFLHASGSLETKQMVKF